MPVDSTRRCTALNHAFHIQAYVQPALRSVQPYMLQGTCVCTHAGPRTCEAEFRPVYSLGATGGCDSADHAALRCERQGPHLLLLPLLHFPRPVFSYETFLSGPTLTHLPTHVHELAHSPARWHTLTRWPIYIVRDSPNDQVSPSVEQQRPGIIQTFPTE